jgi:hypothetical protein
MLAEEVPEQEGEESKEGEEELLTPILAEQRRQAAEVAVAEQQLAVASLEQEREVLLAQETYKEVVLAAAQGLAGREVLLQLSKKAGHPGSSRGSRPAAGSCPVPPTVSLQVDEGDPTFKTLPFNDS